MRANKERPEFRDADFLRDHALRIMNFYDGRCVDPSGGFYQFYKDDGRVYDPHTRHLVGSARFVVTHAWAARRLADSPRAAAWRDNVAHGLRFLNEVHHDPASGGYAWLLRFEHGRRQLLDTTQHCHGLAFVLLAHAHALACGVEEAAEGLERTFELMDRHFWEPAHGLYANDADAAWRLSPYRGQNANLQACAALLAAFDATDDARYLDRAASIAEALVQRLAAAHGGLIWEHYRSDWSPDADVHRDDRGDTFRPWGIQPGHLAAWAKVLLALERALPGLDLENWLWQRARQLFAAAVQHGWDRTHGGLVYTLAPDLTPANPTKLHWVQAEAIAAAAVLGERTVEGGYWDWYDRLWAYAWDHFVDHRHGAWYAELDARNDKIHDNKSPAPKADYHTLGACFDALDALRR